MGSFQDGMIAFCTMRWPKIYGDKRLKSVVFERQLDKGYTCEGKSSLTIC